MRLEHAFEVPASPDETMALLLDAGRVVPCMPGAKLVEIVDDRHWKAELGVKLGPVGMQFLVDIQLLEQDPKAHAVQLGVKGRDTRGKGGAEATVDSVLSPAGQSGTRVEMATDLHFSGQAAQLGRPSVVQSVSNKLVDQFADCIKTQLSGDPGKAAAAHEEAQKPVSGISLAASALASEIKRPFGRKGDRKEEGDT